MAKWLLTADWHIGKYSSYNFSNDSRLLQFPKLAHRVSEIAKENGIDTLLVLGDFIDIPVNIPRVQVVIKECIDILKSNFEKIYYVVGQHCQFSKSNKSSHQDTILSMFDDEKWIYMNQQLLEVDGHLFGFMDWTPKQSLDWIGDKHLDVLFGHFTKSKLFGQSIDESKFDLFFFGDIHKKFFMDGKYVSIGNPIQHDLKSQSEGTYVIFDTETLQWSHGEIDPDHSRFLRIGYTQDQSEEGFENELSYKVYKPLVKNQDNAVQTTELSWSNVDELVANKCKENGLEVIHSEVMSKCIGFNEVDFNFQVTYLEVEGYRSIENTRIDFTRNDRVALFGSNGSGKSSIIRALQAIFLKNSEVHKEQSMFTDHVKVKCGIVYQNKLYEITKGTEWELSIDGQVQNYNGVRNFESDVIAQLPFIDYLDLFFINSGVQNLATKFTPTRRIELISRFYRLDRIQAYCDTARDLIEQAKEEQSKIKTDLTAKVAVLDFNKNRKKDLGDLTGLYPEDLSKELSDYESMKLKYSERRNWEVNLEKLRTKISEAESKLTDLSYKSDVDVESMALDVQDQKQKKQIVVEQYNENYKKSIEFESLLKDHNYTLSEGKKMKAEYEKVKIGKCPTCGGTLANDSLIKQYEKELEEMKVKYKTIKSSIDSHPEGIESKKYYVDLLTNLSKANKDLDVSIQSLENIIKSQSSIQSSIQSQKAIIDQLRSDLQEHLDSEVEKVVLPINLEQLIVDIRSKLSKIQELDKIDKDLETLNGEIDLLTLNMNNSDLRIRMLTDYAYLTESNGGVMVEILKILVNRFNSSEILYEVDNGIYRNSQYINFNAYLLSKGRKIPYDACSDGQKTICDLDFLSKLFSLRVGLLVLDEYLKHLDESNFSKACSILTDLEVNTLILSTHENNFINYTKKVMLALDSEGKSVIQVESNS